jgi:uncharacterized membrane protein YuzA (DUF378 family)
MVVEAALVIAAAVAALWFFLGLIKRAFYLAVGVASVYLFYSWLTPQQQQLLNELLKKLFSAVTHLL